MKIMLPLDGSSLAESALPWADALAHHLGASVTIVGVIDPFVVGQVPSLALRLTEHDRSHREDYLRKLADQIKQAPCDWNCPMGSPPRVLGGLAQPEHCQAVVMASHGRSGGSRWLLGSVAESVLRQSSVPVLLLRPHPEARPGAFRRVLVPVDGSPQSEAFLPHLKPWLAADARVIFMRATGFDANAYINVVDIAAHQKFLEDVEAKLAQLQVEGVEVQAQALEGDAVECILSLATTERCDLVAMSTHGRSGWQRFLLGSVTEKVTRTAPCPVLVFPQKGSDA